MSLWTFLMEIVILLGGAFVLGALAQRLRQNPIVGYLAAGMVAGPLLFNPEAIYQTAELGVALLLFSIGLEFSFGRLKSMGRMAFGAGTIQVSASVGLVAIVLMPFIDTPQALAVGAIVALSSTAVVMRVLVDRAEIDSVRGRTCLAILLLQDIAIVPLVILVSLMAPIGEEIAVGAHIFKIAAAAGGLALILYLVLYWAAPALLLVKGMYSNRELSVLLAITAGLGASWAAHTLGISPALGAFVAGMLLGESPFAAQIQADIGSLRTVMVTLFFASVGMLVKPLFFLSHVHWIFLAGAGIFIFKTVLVYIPARLFGLEHRYALATGISLGQIGEFSLVLATSAWQGNLLAPPAFDLIISIIIVLMFATPYMVAGAFPIADRFMKRSSKTGSQAPPALSFSSHILVVGFGPAGRQIVDHLKDQHFETTVIDVNPLSRAEAGKMGIRFCLGDATHEEILSHANLQQSCMAVVTVPDPSAAVRIVKTLRRLHPQLPIAARCRYNRYFRELEEAGADIVVDEEISIGLLLARKISDYLQDASGQTVACRLAGRTLQPVESGPLT